MARHPYIAIEGVIGVGKTTLARLLQAEFETEAVLEVFEENPFLSDFYGDRQRYAFQTQLFFLLSRYRQQSTLIPSSLARGPVLADYVFAKDRLFAHLNLRGDELTMYERVYLALGEKVQMPDLLVYLRADQETLMRRIALRDRPYERNMDPAYIEQLRLAYEDFMTGYSDGPIIIIDTTHMDFVKNPEDLARIVERIKSQLEYGTYQAQLPGVELDGAARASDVLNFLENGERRLSEFQQFHLSLDAEKGFVTDPFLNYIGLSEEMGELARALKMLWLKQNQLHQSGLSQKEAHRQAMGEFRSLIQEELADNLAFLLKLSNYAGIDLEQAYLAKMDVNTRRRWENGKAIDV